MIKIAGLILVVQIFAIGCKKSPIPEGDGKALGQKNGETWEATARVSFKSRGGFSEDTIQFRFSTYTKEGFERDHLAVYAIPLALQQVELGEAEPTRSVSSALLALAYDDGHVTGDIYDVLIGHPLNHFELTELSRETGRIKGRFALAMIVDTSRGGGKRDPAMPDTFLFTDVKFQVYMEELRD